MENIIELMNNRRSVRYYDPNVSITKEEIQQMLQEATTAPSGNNLQPWRFLVITDPVIKEKMLPICFNQKQVVDAPAVVLVLGDRNAYTDASIIDDIYERAVKTGYMTTETKETLIGNLINYYASKGEVIKDRNIVTDGSLVSMQLMLVAKAHGYDTVPMLGYDQKALFDLLEIPERYINVMLLPIGKALKEGHKTVRYDIDEITYFNKLD